MSNVGIIYDNSKGLDLDEPDSNLDKLMDAYVEYQRDALVGAAAMAILGHAAQSQFSGTPGMALRTIGRVGIRAVPILGAAAIAYSLYDYFS